MTDSAILMQTAGDDLPPAERRAAQVLIEAFADLDDETTASIATKAGVDPATVVRAVRRLGFGGFRELKLAAARASAMAVGLSAGEIDDEDDDDTVVRQLMTRDASALALASRMIDTTSLSAVADAVVSAESVLCCGVGTSNILAQRVALRLLTLGIRATWPPDGQTQLITGRLLGPRGALVVISEHAISPEVLAVVRAAKAGDADISLITSASRTAITALADRVVRIPEDPTTPRPDWFESRVIEASILHALHVLVYRRRRDASNTALMAVSEALGWQVAYPARRDRARPRRKAAP